MGNDNAPDGQHKKYLHKSVADSFSCIVNELAEANSSVPLFV